MPSGRRWQLSDSVNGFQGAMTTLLPAATVADAPVNLYSSNKLWRIVIRPSGTCQADQRWLTIFDAATTSQALHGTKIPDSMSTNVKGALLTSATNNKVALFGAGGVGVPISGDVQFTIPATSGSVSTSVLIADLPVATSPRYSVTVTQSGTNNIILIKAATTGTTYPASEGAGTLAVTIASDRSVTAGI